MAETKLKPQAMDPTTRLVSKVISFTRDIAGTGADVAYTGVGFTPTAVIFHFGTTDGKCYGNGSVDSAKGQSVVVTSQSAGYVTFDQSTAHCIYFTNGSGTNQQGSLKSLDADGFTITWTKVGSPTGTGKVTAICFK